MSDYRNKLRAELGLKPLGQGPDYTKLLPAAPQGRNDFGVLSPYLPDAPQVDAAIESEEEGTGMLSGALSFVGRVTDFASNFVGLQALQGFVVGAIDPQEGALDQAWKHRPWLLGGSTESVDAAGAVMRRIGGTTGSGALDFALSLTSSVVLDPTTWLTAGTAAVAKGARFAPAAMKELTLLGKLEAGGAAGIRWHVPLTNMYVAPVPFMSASGLKTFDTFVIRSAQKVGAIMRSSPLLKKVREATTFIPGLPTASKFALGMLPGTDIVQQEGHIAKMAEHVRASRKLVEMEGNAARQALDEAVQRMPKAFRERMANDKEFAAAVTDAYELGFTKLDDYNAIANAHRDFEQTVHGRQVKAALDKNPAYKAARLRLDEALAAEKQALDGVDLRAHAKAEKNTKKAVKALYSFELPIEKSLLDSAGLAPRPGLDIPDFGTQAELLDYVKSIQGPSPDALSSSLSEAGKQRKAMAGIADTLEETAAARQADPTILERTRAIREQRIAKNREIYEKMTNGDRAAFTAFSEAVGGVTDRLARAEAVRGLLNDTTEFYLPRQRNPALAAVLDEQALQGATTLLGPVKGRAFFQNRRKFTDMLTSEADQLLDEIGSEATHHQPLKDLQKEYEAGQISKHHRRLKVMQMMFPTEWVKNVLWDQDQAMASFFLSNPLEALHYRVERHIDVMNVPQMMSHAFSPGAPTVLDEVTTADPNQMAAFADKSAKRGLKVIRMDQSPQAVAPRELERAGVAADLELRRQATVAVIGESRRNALEQAKVEFDVYEGATRKLIDETPDTAYPLDKPDTWHLKEKTTYEVPPAQAGAAPTRVRLLHEEQLDDLYLQRQTAALDARDAKESILARKRSVLGGEAAASAPAGVAETVVLHRGVSASRIAGTDPWKEPEYGAFWSPERWIADIYGAGGHVKSKRIAFKNLLKAETIKEAKVVLGLAESATTPDVVEAAGRAGYDGISMKIRDGLEYVDLRDFPPDKVVGRARGAAAFDAESIPGKEAERTSRRMADDTKEAYRQTIHGTPEQQRRIDAARDRYSRAASAFDRGEIGKPAYNKARLDYRKARKEVYAAKDAVKTAESEAVSAERANRNAAKQGIYANEDDLVLARQDYADAQSNVRNAEVDLKKAQTDKRGVDPREVQDRVKDLEAAKAYAEDILEAHPAADPNWTGFHNRHADATLPDLITRRQAARETMRVLDERIALFKGELKEELRSLEEARGKVKETITGSATRARTVLERTKLSPARMEQETRAYLDAQKSGPLAYDTLRAEHPEIYDRMMSGKAPVRLVATLPEAWDETVRLANDMRKPNPQGPILKVWDKLLSMTKTVTTGMPWFIGQRVRDTVATAIKLQQGGILPGVRSGAYGVAKDIALAVRQAGKDGVSVASLLEGKFAKINGQMVPLVELLNTLQRHQVINARNMTHDEIIMGMAEEATRKGGTGPKAAMARFAEWVGHVSGYTNPSKNPLVKLARRNANVGDDGMRILGFLGALENGADEAGAAMLVRKWTYGLETAATSTEKQIIGRAVVFRHFASWAAERTAELMVTKPGWLTLPDKVYTAAVTATTEGDPERRRALEAVTPRFIKDNYGIPVGNGPDGPKYFLMGAWLDQSNIEQLASSLFQSSGDSDADMETANWAGKQFHPGLKFLIEAASGRSTYTGRPIESFPDEHTEIFGIPVTKSTARFLRQIKTLNDIDRLNIINLGKDGNLFGLGDAVLRNVGAGSRTQPGIGRQMAGHLLGVGTADVDAAESIRLGAFAEHFKEQETAGRLRKRVAELAKPGYAEDAESLQKVLAGTQARRTILERASKFYPVEASRQTRNIFKRSKYSK